MEGRLVRVTVGAGASSTATVLELLMGVQLEEMQYQLKTERNATEKAELTGRESHERIVKTLRAAEHKLDRLEEVSNLAISSVACRT